MNEDVDVGSRTRWSSGDRRGDECNDNLRWTGYRCRPRGLIDRRERQDRRVVVFDFHVRVMPGKMATVCFGMSMDERLDVTVRIVSMNVLRRKGRLQPKSRTDHGSQNPRSAHGVKCYAMWGAPTTEYSLKLSSESRRN
jgi:hypothetical protein